MLKVIVYIFTQNSKMSIIFYSIVATIMIMGNFYWDSESRAYATWIPITICMFFWLMNLGDYLKNKDEDWWK